MNSSYKEAVAATREEPCYFIGEVSIELLYILVDLGSKESRTENVSLFYYLIII